MKITTLAVLTCALGILASGSHITSVSTSVPCATASSCGTPDNIVPSFTFLTQGNEMGGMTVTASFAGGLGNGVCVWANGTNGCSTASFAISYPGADTTDPDNALATSLWTITNKSSVALSSIVLNGFVGNTSFDRCLVSNPGLNGGALTFDDASDGLHNNYGNTVCNTAKANTDFGAISGSFVPNYGLVSGEYGWSASDNGPSGSPGTATGVIATALYSNLLTTGDVPTAPGDEWGSLTLTFGGTAFSTINSTFTFRSDTDSIVTSGGGGGVESVPEPATAGLVGLALLCLGSLRFRRRSR